MLSFVIVSFHIFTVSLSIGFIILPSPKFALLYSLLKKSLKSFVVSGKKKQSLFQKLNEL